MGKPNQYKIALEESQQIFTNLISAANDMLTNPDSKSAERRFVEKKREAHAKLIDNSSLLFIGGIMDPITEEREEAGK